MGNYAFVATHAPTTAPLRVKVIHEQIHCINNGCPCDLGDFETTTGENGRTTISNASVQAHYFRGLRESNEELIMARARHMNDGGNENDFWVDLEFYW